MTLRAISVLGSEQINPRERFPVPGANAVFSWHKWAPGPCYSMCVVKIVEIISADQIAVQFFTREAQLVPTRVVINLNDWTMAWRAFPSTIGTLPSTTDGLDDNNCAVLCVTDEVLLPVLNASTVALAKYPYAEESPDNSPEAMERQNAMLRKAIVELKAQISSDVLIGLSDYQTLHQLLPEL